MKFRNLVLPCLLYMQYGLSFVEFNSCGNDGVIYFICILFNDS